MSSGFSDFVLLKPASSVTETSLSAEIWHVTNVVIVLYAERRTKALTRLRGCAGWSAPMLFTWAVLSRRCIYYPIRTSVVSSKQRLDLLHTCHRFVPYT